METQRLLNMPVVMVVAEQVAASLLRTPLVLQD
jgi:hypothetical protein